jgi:hypothetical protein
MVKSSNWKLNSVAFYFVSLPLEFVTLLFPGLKSFPGMMEMLF